MNTSYTVPIIPKNLNKNEAIIQIAELFDHLTTVSNDLFQKIDLRLESNKTRLKNMSERVDIVHKKIDKLKGAKKATQVFSSSKYPAGDINRDYVSLFDNTRIQLKRHRVKHKNYAPVYEPIDKISSYLNKNGSKQNKIKYDGIGSMPNDIDFVNDLLLYNSGKNLYSKFEMSDALKGPQLIREDESIDVSDIGVAPYSIREGASMNKSNIQPFFYTPKIGEVPELDVPLDLPDLPGIADDLRYENDNAPTIAPSALTPSIITDLPPIESLNLSDESKIPESELPLPPPPPIESPKEVPLLPIPESIIEKNIVEEDILPKQPSPEMVKEILHPVKKMSAASTDVRASLMEAIRKAGGSKNAKLKTIMEETPKNESKSPSGDLMADLHAKLSMRRKGISGTKNTENEGFDANSALGKISAMIPAPSKNELTDSTNTEDEDWDE